MEAKDQKIAVIIVNYNAGHDLMTCIRAINESGISAHIIVVDNASRDGSLEKCRASYSKYSYIVHSHNLGFAAGVNAGIRYALEKQLKKIILVNPDAILEQKCLQELSQTLNNPEVGIVNPIIRNPNHKIWYAGARPLFSRQRVEHLEEEPTTKNVYDTEIATGCVMGISALLVKKIGLFDERFFLYYEDADYSMRALDDGFRVVVNPKAVALHKEVSEGNKIQKTYFLVLAGLLFFHKHAKGLAKVWTITFTFVRRVRIDIKSLIFGDEMSQTLQRAFKDFRYAKKDKRLISHR